MGNAKVSKCAGERSEYSSPKLVSCQFMYFVRISISANMEHAPVAEFITRASGLTTTDWDMQLLSTAHYLDIVHELSTF